MVMRKDRVMLEGVALSHPDKVLYPEQGITKLALAEFYRRIGDLIMPHLEHRPVSIVRCPQGSAQKCFYQKHVNESLPDYIHGVTVPEKESEGQYIVLNDLKSLIGMVQLGVLEFHPWGSREDRLDNPDIMTFDLDPAEDVTLEQLVEGTLELVDILDRLGLRSFLKTSGGKGYHVVAPLARKISWDELKSFSQSIAVRLSKQRPDKYIATMSKAKRRGKIFVDYLRNGRGATSVAAWSTRARAGAPVSAPISREELESGVRPDSFTVTNLDERLKALKIDPWADYFKVRQSITAKMRKEAEKV